MTGDITCHSCFAALFGSRNNWRYNHSSVNIFQGLLLIIIRTACATDLHAYCTCALKPTLEHSSVGHAAVLETGPLPPQDHRSGTVCHPISDYVGCHSASSGGYWRHFCLENEATVQCELFLTAPNRNILTYPARAALAPPPPAFNAPIKCRNVATRFSRKN